MSDFLKESFTYAKRQATYIVYDVILDSLAHRPKLQNSADSCSDSSSSSSGDISEGEYERAMGEVGQERDYKGFC